MKPIRRPPAYLAKIAAAHDRARSMGVKPGVFIVDIHHDDGCPLLEGAGPCNCDADVGEMHRVPDPGVA